MGGHVNFMQRSGFTPPQSCNGLGWSHEECGGWTFGTPYKYVSRSILNNNEKIKVDPYKACTKRAKHKAPVLNVASTLGGKGQIYDEEGLSKLEWLKGKFKSSSFVQDRILGLGLVYVHNTVKQMVPNVDGTRSKCRYVGLGGSYHSGCALRGT